MVKTNDIVLIKENSLKRVGVVKGWIDNDGTIVDFLTIPEQVFFDNELIIIKPNSFWLVNYECRLEIIRISPIIKIDKDKKEIFGFFAPGQEPCWGLSAITEWIKEIKTDCLSFEESSKNQENLDQEINFELGERKLNDFLEQQEEIRAAQRIMSVDGN